MFNLTVDEAHTFFVGEQDWLVHNCEPIIEGPYGNQWYALDPDDGHELGSVTLETDRFLVFDINTKTPPTRVRGTDVVRDLHNAVIDAGNEVVGIRGTWMYGDNLEAFMKVYNSSIRETRFAAAQATWTARRASELGYTNIADVRFIDVNPTPNNQWGQAVIAEFVRP
jgi:hypothetical protein